MPAAETLGKWLPKSGFLYNEQEQIFSDPASAGLVMNAIKTVKGTPTLNPDDVDHCLGLLFSFAADVAHTMYGQGDNFWPSVMKTVPWTKASLGITPQVVRELTAYVMKARVRCKKYGARVALLNRAATAMAMDRFFENLKEAGMKRFIPVLGDDEPLHQKKRSRRGKVWNDGRAAASTSTTGLNKQQKPKLSTLDTSAGNAGPAAIAGSGPSAT